MLCVICAMCFSVLLFWVIFPCYFYSLYSKEIPLTMWSVKGLRFMLVLVCSLWPCRTCLRKRMLSILWYWQKVRQGYKPEIYQNVNPKLYVFCAIWAEALSMYIKYGNCYVSLIVYLRIKSMIDMESLSHDSHMPLLFLVPLCFWHIEVYIWHNVILYLLLNSLSVTAYPLNVLIYYRQ